MPAWRVGESTYIERVYTRRPRGDLVEPALIAIQQIRPSVVGRVVDAKSRNSSVSSVSLCPLCRTQRPIARDDVMQERSRRVCLNTEDTETQRTRRTQDTVFLVDLFCLHLLRQLRARTCRETPTAAPPSSSGSGRTCRPPCR